MHKGETAVGWGPGAKASAAALTPPGSSAPHKQSAPQLKQSHTMQRSEIGFRRTDVIAIQ